MLIITTRVLNQKFLGLWYFNIIFTLASKLIITYLVCPKSKPSLVVKFMLVRMPTKLPGCLA